MIYECAVPFSVPKYDADGFETSDSMTVDVGSLWELNDDGGNIIGADHHLDNCDGSSWLEIDDDAFKSNFKEADHA